MSERATDHDDAGVGNNNDLFDIGADQKMQIGKKQIVLVSDIGKC